MNYATLWDWRITMLNILKKNVSAERVIQILVKPGLTEDKFHALRVNGYQYPSLEVRPYFKRHYLYGETIAYFLGYVGKMNDKDVERLKRG